MFALPIGGKPEPPYTVGWRCTVHSHEPPRPTLVTKDSCRNLVAGWSEKAQHSPVERCLRHPPLPGLDKPRNVDLEIIEVKKGADNHDSQVVIVEVLGHIQRLKKGRRAVAKFYDPLYFDDDEGFLNPFTCGDTHYTHESTTYITLADLMGKKIPKFYGSFSVSLPVDESHTRTVRLILLHYNQVSRQVLLKSAIDFEGLVYKRDILLTDFTLRNIILVDLASCSEMPDLVFLDFGGALFGRTRNDAVVVAYRVNLFFWEHIYRLSYDGLSFPQTSINGSTGIWQAWLDQNYGHAKETTTEKMPQVFSE
ncbi:hypothetical protein BDV33DRAFT_229236 [Aspergillus novoparasiticus]|uniref:Protein kinase domain-containing protein n=1 Tax=Aspergillus novoparasiticus TaxID=986946 RepID=A0A5N6F8B5_9EURO|nr:hypothetical protein BDV33DRAFT_229236 [Aspergillus novoparasiticus]